MDLAYIPSPSQGVWHLGPLPIRAYALCILAGVAMAIFVGNRRWLARGGRPGTMGDIAVWAIPFGLVGARLYNVVTDPELYFGSGRDPWDAFKVWNGGLGVWGAVAVGALGGYIACRRRGISFLAIADAAAPGIVLAQAIGRWGNYFNQELYGKPSTLPWALEISPAHRETSMLDKATYQPTFLYESIWDLGVAGLVIWAERRFSLGWGRAFALYVMAYTVGRGWIEYLRVDTANHILGVRLNVFTAVVVFLLALVFFLVSRKRHPGPQPIIDTRSVGAAGSVSSAVGDEPPDSGLASDEVPDEPVEQPAGADPPQATGETDGALEADDGAQR